VYREEQKRFYLDARTKDHRGHLTVNPSTLARLHKKASDSPRKEVCGLLTVAGTIIPVTNVAKAEDSFIMSRTEYLTALNLIRTTGETLQCVYHSHLHGVPIDHSPADLKYIASSKIDSLIINSTDWRYLPYASLITTPV
jgi:proteasome lid subunit RPN8/RPN11